MMIPSLCRFASVSPLLVWVFCHFAATNGAQIPRNIIQTGPRKADFIKKHPEWIQYQAVMKVVNRNFNHTFLDDVAGLALIDKHFNHTILPHVARNVQRPVMRADLIRLASIAVYGGFYMDLDMLARSWFEPLVAGSGDGTYTAVFPKEWWRHDSAYRERHFGDPEDDEDHWQVGNYAFAAVPGHEFVLDALEEAMKRCMELTSLEVTDLEILRTTGPYMLSEVYHEGRKEGRYASVLHLPGDDAKPTRDCEPFCGENDWHKFGPYAEHMLTHSWVSERQLQGLKGKDKGKGFDYDDLYNPPKAKKDPPKAKTNSVKAKKDPVKGNKNPLPFKIGPRDNIFAKKGKKMKKSRALKGF